MEVFTPTKPMVPTDDSTAEPAVHSDASDQAQDQVEPFRRLADAIPHVFWITQLDPERVIYVSPSFETIWGRTAQELYEDPRVWTACIHPEDRAGVEAEFVKWITGQDRTAKKLEYRVVQPSGALRWITDYGVVTYDRNNRPVRVSGVCTDITELKLAEREHLSHLWFLESLDRVNQAIQGTNDLEQMMSAVLDEVQRTFACDRAWLLSALEPSAGPFQLVLSRGRSASTANQLDERTIAGRTAELFARIGNGPEVTRFGGDSELEVPAELANGLGVRSLLCTSLSAKVGTKYLLQLQQCDHARSWSREEERLFREIARRLADAISTLWTVRQLRESEARLEAAQRQAHLGYWSLDLHTEVLTWSAETHRIYGLAPQAQPVRLSDLRALVHPEDAQAVRDAEARAIRESGSYVVEYRALRPSSELRYVHADGHVVRDTAGRAIGLFGTVQDITERKRAEQLFATQHAVTKLLAEAPELADAAPRILEVICESLAWDLGVLWQLDAQRKTLYCAELWQRAHLSGASVGAWLRRARFELDQEPVGVVWSKREPAFSSDIAESGRSVWAAAAHGGLHASFAFPVPIGADVWAVLQFFSQETRVRDQDLLATMATLGSQIGQFVERKQAETALQHARDQLAHVTRVASLGEMTASIAHEVNQPLTGIIANAHAALRWLSRDPPALQEALDAIQRLARDGRRAGDVITRLKTLIRRGDTRTKGPTDVNLVVRETLPLVRSEIQQNRVAIELELAAELPQVIGDRVQLQQVLLNLISNALEAMSDVEERPCRLTIRSSDPGGGMVELSVGDSGIGLHPEGMSRIFDAFFTTKPQGMGMGLAISRSIVEDHGGRLSVTSRPGEGSTFQFTLRKAGRDS